MSKRTLLSAFRKLSPSSSYSRAPYGQYHNNLESTLKPSNGNIYKTTIPVNSDVCPCVLQHQQQQQIVFTTPPLVEEVSPRNPPSAAISCACTHHAEQMKTDATMALAKTVNKALSDGVHPDCSVATCVSQFCNDTCNTARNPAMEVGNRDRLGLWSLDGDNEVPGRLSGIDRLRQKRFNKVRIFPENFPSNSLPLRVTPSH